VEAILFSLGVSIVGKSPYHSLSAVDEQIRVCEFVHLGEFLWSEIGEEENPTRLWEFALASHRPISIAL
jgi:hypothetical protein